MNDIRQQSPAKQLSDLPQSSRRQQTMESRRHHHGGNSSNNGGGRGFNSNRRGRGGGRGGGGRGGGFHSNHSSSNNGFQATRGSYWFKGEGYNDHEAVSIDEEVVGISGFLSTAQPGFSGLVKQRFSDFIVHEIAKNGQPIVLTSLAKKKKHVSHHFQDLVAAFAYGESAGSPRATNGKDGAGEQRDASHNTCLQVLRAMGEQLGKQGHQLMLQGRKAMEAHNARKLIELITAELGKKMGKDFEDFIAKVKQVRLAEEEQAAAANAAANSSNGTAPTAVPTTTTPAGTEPLVFYIGGLNEKRERVFLHETMRRYGKSLIVADTITSEDHSQVIRVRRAFTPGAIKKGERDPRKEWPIEQPDYLQFVLYRRNKDITAVVNQMASVLKVSPSIFSFADPKDKRGIVTQLCTAHRLPIEKLLSLQRLNTSKALEEYQFLLGGNLKYVPTKLSLGDCAGNRYSIVIRALAEKDLPTAEVVNDTVAHWSKRGFVNFFGLQRFGNSATPFHLIGRAVLRKDFKLAVLLLLRPQDGEASKIREAREHFRQHKDVAAALRMLPPFLVPERAVLEGLLQNGIDANELAFRAIPLSFRVAYVEAYQNYVWNEMASLRIAQLSAEKAVVGDLVFAKEEEGETPTIKEEEEDGQPAKKKLKRTDGDSVAITTSQPSVSGTKQKRTVLVLTEANVHEYAIEDVVLPLPGHSIEFPTNEIGAAYQKMLTTDGVDLASWLGVHHTHQQYQLDGAYRHVIKKPFQVSAHVQEYDNVNKPLLLTDVDNLLDRRLDAVDLKTKDVELKDNDAATTRKTKRALVLHFELEYGSDATVAVRELMKQSSSMHVQWQLSDQQAQGKDAAAASAKPKDKTNSQQQGATAGKKIGVPGTSVSGSGSAAGGKGDKKIIAQKKTQVSIGRPGFSLGKH